MNDPVLILYLEDNPRDAELVRDKLRQIAMPHELRIARDRAEYEAALAQTCFDLILSDYALPDYDGMAALALARERQPDVPFILISGTLGEEQAVDCVVRGAIDYVLKQNLNRLLPAVLRALTEAEAHQKRRVAEKELVRSTALLRKVLDMVPAYICAKNREGRFLLANKKLEDFYDVPANTMTGMLHADLCKDKEELRVMLAADREVIESGAPIWIREETMQKSDGSAVVLETHKIPFTTHDEPAVLIIASDITARRQAEEGQARQLDELRRWYVATLGREKRVGELKREVNALAARLGQPPPYAAPEDGERKENG